MKNYTEKFNLNNKNIFIIGGMGLIGKEITKAISSSGARTIVLDLIGQDKGEIR